MKKGFTLIELAVVTVIVGLLIAGLIIGQSLVRSAKIQEFIVDNQEYSQAVGLFEQKYKFLPGDYPFATDQWSGTFNGNGDGDASDTISASRTENGLFWQHLSLSGLISDSFDGTLINKDTNPLPSINIPELDTDLVGSGYRDVDARGFRYDFFNGPDLYVIDNKIDDGLVRSGELSAFGATSGCPFGGGISYDPSREECQYNVHWLLFIN